MAQADPAADLIRRARAHDREAFAELYRRTVVPVYRYCAVRLETASDAEEVTQEVYVAALAGIGRLRAEGELALLAWLYQIARHKLADRLRARYRRPTAPLAAADQLPANEPLPQDIAFARADRAAVHRALGELTADQREVIVCKYVLGYDNARTGAIVGKNANAVNQLHHRALARLRGLLEGERQP